MALKGIWTIKQHLKIYVFFFFWRYYTSTISKTNRFHWKWASLIWFRTVIRYFLANSTNKTLGLYKVKKFSLFIWHTHLIWNLKNGYQHSKQVLLSHFTFDRHLIHSTDSETLLLTLPVAIMVGRTEIWCFWDVTPLQFHSHAFKIWEAFWFLFRNVLEEVQEMKEMHSKEDEWSSEEEDNTINREKQVLYSHLEDIK